MHWLKLYLSTSLLGGAATCAPWRGDQFLGHPKVLLITHHEQRVTWPRCSQNAIRRHWSREYGSPEQAGGSALIQYVLKAFLYDPEEIPKTERKKIREKVRDIRHHLKLATDCLQDRLQSHKAWLHQGLWRKRCFTLSSSWKLRVGGFSCSLAKWH